MSVKFRRIPLVWSLAKVCVLKIRSNVACFARTSLRRLHDKSAWSVLRVRETERFHDRSSCRCNPSETKRSAMTPGPSSFPVLLPSFRLCRLNCKFFVVYDHFSTISESFHNFRQNSQIDRSYLQTPKKTYSEV